MAVVAAASPSNAPRRRASLSLESPKVSLPTIQRKATVMSELRYPNESREYREARDALLEDEQQLIDKVKAVAAKRLTLPPGGALKEDYVFQWASDSQTEFKRALAPAAILVLLAITVLANMTAILLRNHYEKKW